LAEVPLPLRDALYHAFRSALDSGRAFSASLPKPAPSEAYYLADRAPRFEQVLASWAGRPPKGPAQALLLGQDLYNAGLYFDCHEYLEAFWRGAEGPDRLLLHGMIQAAAALHKLELDPNAREGAVYLLDRALEKLWEQVSGERLQALLETRRRLMTGTLDLSEVPELRLAG
jgi:hypothetical protein